VSLCFRIENYTYFPFSLGPRNCIGQNFAQFEAVAIIAKLFQRFEIRLDPDQPMHADTILTVKPVGGAKCFLTLRS
jgi:cholesterol 24(S)-hydroxylase